MVSAMWRQVKRSSLPWRAYPELRLSSRVVGGIVPDAAGQVVIFPVKIELDDPVQGQGGDDAEAEIVVERRRTSSLCWGVTIGWQERGAK